MPNFVHRSFGIIIIFFRRIRFADSLGLAELVDGFEATLGVTNANGLVEVGVALAERVSTDYDMQDLPVMVEKKKTYFIFQELPAVVAN